MNIENLNGDITPEERAEIEKSRVISDAALLEADAEYDFSEYENGILRVTKEQIEGARQEMEAELAERAIEGHEGLVARKITTVEGEESVTTTEYEYKDGRLQREYSGKEFLDLAKMPAYPYEKRYSYHENGNVREVRTETHDGGFNELTLSLYDENGNEVYRDWVRIYGESYQEGHDTKFEYTFDDNGRPLEVMGSSTKENRKRYYDYASKDTYKHNDEENSTLIKKVSVKAWNETGMAGKIEKFVSYLYQQRDDEGRIIGEITAYPNGNEVSREEQKFYFYNDRGQIVREERINKEGGKEQEPIITNHDYQYV